MLSFTILVQSAHAATGDISAVTIRSDGWSADIDISGFISTSTTNNMGFGTNNDPANSKITFSVTSLGYDTSGVATTITRTLYGTKIVRMPYPDEGSLNIATTSGKVTIRVALSDFVYSGDSGITTTMSSGWYTDDGTGGTGSANNSVSALAVTNNSVLAYPKAVGRWAWPGYERVTGDFLVEAVVFNRFARNGKPVAAVVFTATDQHSNTVTQTATDMTKTTRTGDVNQVLVYAATMPVSTLTQGDVITVNFAAYPWVGDSSAVMNSAVGSDGVAQPDERLGPIYQINDKSGTYGVGYALVSNSGVDASGAVYSSQSAAEAGSAYLTIEKAAEGIKTYHNTNHARNNAGGGVIVLAEGTFQYPGTSASTLGASMATWLIIKPASTAAKANTIINGGNNAGMESILTKIEGLTLATTTGVNTIKGRTETDVLWLHNNAINMTQVAPVYSFKVAYATQNTISAWTEGMSHFSTTRSPYAIVRGNNSSVNVAADMYNIIGNKNVSINFDETGNTYGHKISDNSIFAFNSVYALTTSLFGTVNGGGISTIIATGTAFVSNVVERKDNLGPLFAFAADVSTATSSNTILWHNTFAGQRTNIGYNEFNSDNYPRDNWSQRFNISWQLNHKDDLFAGGPANGARVRSWPISYNIGSIGSISQQLNFAFDFYGLGYLWGTSTVSTRGVGYNSDKSNSGTGAGNGDYTLSGTSVAIDLATTTSSSEQVLPYDFLGNAIYGPSDSGAYEYQPPYTMGTHQVATSSIVRVYGDEKWRPRTATTTDGTADLSVSIPGSDTTQWLDISISLWDTAGDYQKTWTEMSSTTGLDDTVHVVGDLATEANYIVSVDGVEGSGITGAACTSGVCTSNGSGQITFTYTGGYSTHTFDVSEQPYVAPVVTGSATTVASTGSFGGNASSRVSNLLSIGFYTEAQEAAKQYGINTGVNPPPATLRTPFTQTLRHGLISSDVKKLQIFLNAQGFTVAQKGAGSPGRETSYFGLATKGALMRFQLAHRKEVLDPLGLKNPTGFFGAYTMKLVNEMI